MLSQNPADHTAGQVGTSYSELALRLISACVLVGVTSLGVYWGKFSFACLVLIVATLMIWEWCGLVTKQRFLFSFGALFLLTSAAIFCVYSEYYLLGLLILLFGFIGILFLGYNYYFERRDSLWISFGILYIGLPCLAMVWFRLDHAFGVVAVLYLFSLVWFTDSFAYMFGRLIGGVKLCPQISPNKTWSGFLGGLFGSLLVGCCFVAYLEQSSWFPLLLISLVLGGAAQLGDLAESALKRNFGIKDTGALIPGHGGMLDRVDSLIFTVLLAGLIALSVDPHNPGASLLFGLNASS